MFFVDFVNLVNYKIYMDEKLKNKENEAQIIRHEDLARHNSRGIYMSCLLYTSPSPRDGLLSRMPSSA